MSNEENHDSDISSSSSSSSSSPSQSEDEIEHANPKTIKKKSIQDEPPESQDSQSPALVQYIAKHDKQPGASQRIWTREEIQLLRTEHTEYMKLTTGKDRKRYVTHRVCKKMKLLHGDRYSDKSLENEKRKAEWKAKKKQLFNWFLNHGRKATRMKIKGIKRQTIRDVIVAKKKDELDRLTRTLSGAVPGSDRYLGFYQQAMNDIIKGLDEEEYESMMATLREWEIKGPDPMIQAKNCRRHGRKTVKRMDEIKKNQLGMYSYTLECHWNEDGEMVYAIHDNIAELREGKIEILPFHKYDRKSYEIIEAAWADYASYIANVERGVAKPVKDTELQITDLEFASTGMPACPELTTNKLGHETRIIQIHLIRVFVTAHYRLAKGLRLNDRGVVPWRAIQDNNEAFIHASYLPPDVKLQEPSKMRENEVQTLLEFWRERQENGEIPFKFNAVRGKGDTMIPALYTKSVEAGSPPVMPSIDKPPNQKRKSKTNGPSRSINVTESLATPPATQNTSKSTTGSPDGSPDDSPPDIPATETRSRPRPRPRILPTQSQETESPNIYENTSSNMKQATLITYQSKHKAAQSQGGLQTPSTSHAGTPTSTPARRGVIHQTTVSTSDVPDSQEENDVREDSPEIPVAKPRASSRTIIPPKRVDEIVPFAMRNQGKGRK